MTNKERTPALPILKYPDKRLLTPCEEVTEFGEHLKLDFNEMMKALIAQKWGGHLGLAANQIGIMKRLCIVNGVFMVNPSFQGSKGPKGDYNEGCYSLPRKTYRTERAPYGWAKWQDINGEWHEKKYNDLHAIIIQHEIDHLDGKLCCGDDFKKVEEDFKEEEKQNEIQKETDKAKEKKGPTLLNKIS